MTYSDRNPQRDSAFDFHHESIPDRGIDEERLVEFCLSFDGYRHWGEAAFERLEELQRAYSKSRQLPENSDDLRAFLFMLQRAHRHGGGPGEDFPEIFYAVLDELRRRAFRARGASR